MRNPILKWQLGLSLVPALFLAAHLVWPAVRIDSITLILLGMCFVPWLGALFKSIQLPGGTKFEFHDDLNKATEEAKKAGLLSSHDKQISDPTYLALLDNDPNLALAGLRIDIERKLRSAAQNIPNLHTNSNLRQLLREIQKAGLLKANQVSALNDILYILNAAAHGMDISTADAHQAMEIGQRLLNSPDLDFAN